MKLVAAQATCRSLIATLVCSSVQLQVMLFNVLSGIGTVTGRPSRRLAASLQSEEEPLSSAFVMPPWLSLWPPVLKRLLQFLRLPLAQSSQLPASRSSARPPALPAQIPIPTRVALRQNRVQDSQRSAGVASCRLVSRPSESVSAC